MRYLFGFICTLALGVMPVVGCGETNGGGGSGGSAGVGGGGSGGGGGQGGVGGGIAACVDNVCPCTEAGIRAAIAEGGGPFTFDCDGPTTVVTEATIDIDSDVILDGEGNLTVDGDEDHRVFDVLEGVTAELHRITVTGGSGGGIYNAGTLTLTKMTVSGNSATGANIIANFRGALTLANSTVSGNGTAGCGRDPCPGTIANLDGTLTMTNSTVSGNTGNPGITTANSGVTTITSSTVSGTLYHFQATLILANSLVGVGGDGGCYGLDGGDGGSTITSNGNNIESPGDTCGFDQEGDQVDVTTEDLKLGPLQDNGGPTMTHALLPGSVAIDVIPADMCEVDEDQRGVTRPQGSACDVGAVEMEVAP